MVANEEQILFLISTEMDPYSLALIIYGLAFLLYFCNISSQIYPINFSDFVSDMVIHRVRSKSRFDIRRLVLMGARYGLVAGLVCLPPIYLET
jgi:hypothetical protein